MDIVLNRPDGPQRSYVYTGGRAFDRTQPAVVFLHGALLDHSCWTLLAPFRNASS